MVNIAKFETLHNDLWDKHGEVEIFSGRSEDNKSPSYNYYCVPSEAQTEPCLLDRNLYLCVRAYQKQRVSDFQGVRRMFVVARLSRLSFVQQFF